eukprot:TRINITY_DN7550_c0_g1_i1.p1 TRINITY_DN7550_c0_g1~~TRINITY_DN7550_c0_g1_i1.p1  ORF type:complete len:1377 (+),score=309.69 TRINITY_DN7550_c0_g1_i1:75-4133(+)
MEKLEELKEQERDERAQIEVQWDQVTTVLRGDMIADFIVDSDEEDDYKVAQVNLLIDTTYQVSPYEGEDVEVILTEFSSEIKYYVALLAVHVLLPVRVSAPEILGGVLESLELPDPVIDGLLQLCEDSEYELQYDQVELAASGLPSELRLGVIAALAASGLQSGSYDARLRWALRRMATILKVPWSRVAVAEGILATTLLDKASDASHATKGKGSSYRWLKVGAGVTLGAGVLVITGGLAAPLVAAAATALASTTAGIAAAAGLTTIATAIGATAASLGAVMTIPVITALFGAAGAGLTGLKVYRRTAGVDEFVCKSIRDVRIPPWLVNNPCRCLAADRGPGAAVHLAVRSITTSNMARKIDTDRKVVFAVEHMAPEMGDLHLVASHLEHGEWVYKPPKVLHHGMVAVGAASKTRFGMRVQGCVVYSNADCSIEVMCGFDCPVVGSFWHRVLHGKGLSGDVAKNLVKCMAQPLEWSAFKLQDDGEKVFVSSTGAAEAVFTIDSRSTDTETQTVCIDDKLVSANTVMTHQQQGNYRHAMYVAVLNLAEETLDLVDTIIDCGLLSSKHHFPKSIPSGMVGVAGVHNKKLRPTGAGGYTIYTGKGFTLCVAYLYPVSGGMKAHALIVEDDVKASDVPKMFKEKEKTTEGSVGWCHPETKQQYAVSWEVGKEGIEFTFREVISAQGNLAEVSGLHVVIGVSGMTVHDDPRLRTAELEDCMWLPVLGGDLGSLGLYGADPYFVSWEKELQAKFGEFMSEPTDYGTVMKSAANRGATEAMKNPAVAGVAGLTGAAYFAAATMWASLAWPYYAVQAADIIDSTYVILNKKAKEAGGLLAAMLLEKAQGGRPVTLVGVSIGANVVFHALVALSKAADGAGHGLVESAILIGATVPSKAKRWSAVRSTVAGRLINVYSGHDWFLAFLHRGSTVSLRGVAGLTKVTVKGVENVCVNHLVRASSDYVRKLGEVMACIPPWPTAQTFSTTTTIPGKVTPVEEADEELELIADSSTASNYMAICVRNKSEVTLSLRSATFESGEWEVSPPEEPVFPGNAVTMAARSSSSLATSIHGMAVFETDDNFMLLVVFKVPVYGDAEVLAEMFESTSEVPLLQDMSSKLTVEPGKSFCSDHVVRYERVGNKLAVTLRLSDGIPQRELSSPTIHTVGASMITDTPQAPVVLTKLLTNRFSTSDLGLAIRNKTSLHLVYCWSFMKYGTWKMTPPPEVPPGKAGLAACSGGIRKGVKGVLCYCLEEQFALLLAFSLPLMSSACIYAETIPLEEACDEAAEAALEKLRTSGSKVSWAQDAERGYKLSWKLPPGGTTKMSFTIHAIDASKIQPKRSNSVVLEKRPSTANLMDMGAQ